MVSLVKGSTQLLGRQALLPSNRLVASSLTAVIIIIPGPSVTFIVARTLGHGIRAAVLTVIGNTLGEYEQVVTSAIGIGAVAERSIEVLTVLKLFGAAYLVLRGSDSKTLDLPGGNASHVRHRQVRECAGADPPTRTGLLRHCARRALTGRKD